ncbi:MAG: putative DNA binding domain-containing protein [bacterium]|nr:putative DNA binding domain-containing protein [bacterium]
MKETGKIELKKSTAEWKEIVETVCAFANTEGGKIYIGISNTGKIVGTDIGKKTIEDITNRIVCNTDPKIYPEVSVMRFNNKNVIIIDVKKSLDQLVLAFGRPYKRVGKSTVKMSKDEYERKILEKHRNQLHFDNQICEPAKFADIDNQKLKEFLQIAQNERGLTISYTSTPKEIFMRLNLLKNNNLTNSAILLFGKAPQKFFIQAEVKCVRFKGIDVTGTIVDMKDVGGNLIDQVIEVEKFIFNNIALTSWIENGKIQRQERWEYPPKAIREALVNAVVHRDYRSSAKVQVRIFDDKIEFWNPGRLPDGWTIDKLKEEHESKPFNPLIARMLFWVKYIEEIGTGTNKIIEWCKEWGLPEPDFKFTGTSMVVILRKSKLTEEILQELNERQKEIIKYIQKSGRINRSKAMEILKTSKDTAYRELNGLINKGLLKRKGIGKKVYYMLS